MSNSCSLVTHSKPATPNPVSPPVRLARTRTCPLRRPSAARRPRPESKRSRSWPFLHPRGEPLSGPWGAWLLGGWTLTAPGPLLADQRGRSWRGSLSGPRSFAPPWQPGPLQLLPRRRAEVVQRLNGLRSAAGRDGGDQTADFAAANVGHRVDHLAPGR